jgi:hypothetical protein
MARKWSILSTFESTFPRIAYAKNMPSIHIILPLAGEGKLYFKIFSFSYFLGPLHRTHTGGIRQNLFEIYYFEKLHAPRARGARVRARGARDGRRDEVSAEKSCKQ